MTTTAVRPTWKPHAGQQTRFLQSAAFEVLFGGAAGPGKTDCLLMGALRQIDNPRYTAILFRRIFPSLKAADGMIQRSLRWFPAYGGTYNGSDHVWTFPSGARVYFGHMQYEKDMFQYQGAQFTYAAFDELTEFLESQYLYIFSRVRVPVGSGLTPMVRAATNPGGIGHTWVKQRFITRGIVNQARHFARVDGEDTEVSADHPDALTRAFYPALMDENPSISVEYKRAIRANSDDIQRRWYEDGDWDAEYSKDLIYDTWSIENITQDADYNPDQPVYWGVDDGYVYGQGVGHESYHPRVIIFLQYNELGGFNIFDEYVATGETHAQTIKEALARGYPEPRLAFVDGSAAMFRGELSKAGIHNANGTHTVTEGIKVVRRYIKDANDVRLLRVHPRCKMLIYEMGKYRANDKNAKAGELVPLKVDDHAQDAARYAIFNLRRQ